MRYLKVIISNVIILIVVTVLLSDKVILNVEQPLITVYSKLLGEKANSKKVFIIDIDKKSIQTYGQWPWERKKIAKLIDEVSKYKPKVIGIEILFTEKSDNYNDADLNSAIRKAGNIILASVKSLNKFPFNYEEGYNSKDFEVGFLDRIYDNSGKVLGIHPLIKENGKIYKAFAVAIAEKYNNILVNNIKEMDLLRINFYGSFNTFRHYSASAFLDHAAINSIEGNMVIISSNILPFLENTTFGNMPTSEINANIIQNIIDKTWVRINKTINFIFGLAIGFIFYIAMIMRRKWLGLLITFILYLGFSFALLSKGIIMSTSSVVIVLLFNYFIGKRIREKGTG